MDWSLEGVQSEVGTPEVNGTARICPAKAKVAEIAGTSRMGWGVRHGRRTRGERNVSESLLNASVR